MITGIAHIGIRVHDAALATAFYAHLGFVKTAGPLMPDRVTILEHPAGVEINLIENAPAPTTSNILMDVPVKHAGITHFALLVPDLDAARAQLEAAGVSLSGGPIQFTPSARGFFVRDPDKNVIELHERRGG